METDMTCFTDLVAYGLDTAQRSVLFLDIIRKRGNTYLEHVRNGQPPVLAFPYDIIFDGRTLDRPANYALVQIKDRRHGTPPEGEAKTGRFERRHKPRIGQEAAEGGIRPIVIIDPRAGHGPGIGGSKRDSQIGMALDAGHPVYFMIFFTDPMPEQTLADVRNVQIKFLEEIRRRHPESPKPAVIGNCQGGWAAALIGAERPDLVGPMVFNGSPLSYWGGVAGTNPMRYSGGLLGGSMAQLVSERSGQWKIRWGPSGGQFRKSQSSQHALAKILPRLCECGLGGGPVLKF